MSVCEIDGERELPEWMVIFHGKQNLFDNAFTPFSSIQRYCFRGPISLGYRIDAESDGKKALIQYEF